MSEQDRRRRSAALRVSHWEWWREPLTPGTVACVACGAHVCTTGADFTIPGYRSLPTSLRAGQGKRSQPTLGRSMLIVCPGCHELHEVQVQLKAA